MIYGSTPEKAWFRMETINMFFYQIRIITKLIPHLFDNGGKK